MTQTTSHAGPALEKGIWAAVAVVIVIVALRVIAKIKIHQFRVDDVLMVVASILTIVASVFLTIAVNYGFGSDLMTQAFDNQKMVLKSIAIQVPLVTISTTLARCSFILYLLVILGSNKIYRIILWALMGLQFAANITSAVLPLSICRDVRILWNPTIKTTCGNIEDVVKFAYFTGSLNCAVDFFLAVFPTLVVWNLNLLFRIKISLIVLLSLGIVAMVASIIKTTKLNDIPSVTNLGSSTGIELIRWGYTENVIIIITSSIPCIRPLVISSVRKFSSGGISRSYELTGPFGGSRTRRTGGGGHGRTDTALSTNGKGSRFDRSMNAETGSIERILDDGVYGHRAGAAGGGGGGHETSISSARTGSPGGEDERGITKQVEISVISNEF
ncbi:hypothetical protein P175DRAFT_0471444 [Aspergillus ochraceoroseus IBT 24754]|uniref:Rhodopsin domain-containing protein n=1 Tax=Aspergillus ochraceoroseus IBT 24754 TaxID=1392256 RepID=A0A2T5M8L5_9EURO|nr:uncharacterized protein P175DRAFT_0471444 [Aspergillus ochraceoroseus IBT 24754]PTU24874.1 hypothetical protein P175DRAFT_0471444 [Aspergillus ochraceoroseus IBT 24754]